MKNYTPIAEAEHRANAKAAKARAQNKAASKYRRNKEFRDRMRAAHYENEYGLTLEQYLAMFDAQDHKCALCEKAVAPGSPGRRATGQVDHCHTTGRIRGILCGSCNSRVGICEVVSVEKIVKYLEG